MSRGLNIVQLIGNVGQDVDVRYTTSGTAVSNFSLAINSSWKNRDGEQQDHTEWVYIVAWAKLAEIVGEHVKKGMKVYVRGRLETRTYEDKKCSCKKYKTEIVADELIMLSRPDGQERIKTGQTDGVSGKQETDLPF